MNWLLEGKEVTNKEQFPEGAIGFIYKITNKETGKFYIGRKILENRTKKALTKEEQLQWSKPGRIPKKKLVMKDSNWLEYWGSCKPLLADIKEKGKDKFTREIVRVCHGKKELSYYEMFWQVKLEVLHIDSYNENIAAKWFRKDANPSH